MAIDITESHERYVREIHRVDYLILAKSARCSAKRLLYG